MSAYPSQYRRTGGNFKRRNFSNGYTRSYSQPPETSQDESFAAATKPAPAPRKPVTNDNPKLWTHLNAIRDPNTGATKTTRVMVTPQGCLVNTCTRSATGMCEALVFVPGAKLEDFTAPVTTT